MAVRLGMQRVGIGGQGVMLVVVMVGVRDILRVGALGIVAIKVWMLGGIGVRLVQMIIASAKMRTLRGTTP